MNPKTYQSVPVPVIDTIRENYYLDRLNEQEIVANISSTVAVLRRSYYNTVYSSSSSSDDEGLANFVQISVSCLEEDQLIEKENKPSSIENIRMCSSLVNISYVEGKHYTYKDVAGKEVDGEGERGY